MHALPGHICVSVLAALVFVGCTGITRAPTGSPRVELEVEVNLADSFKNKLEAPDDALAKSLAELVISKADLGLRFYPVLSTAYAARDPRPEYLLRVEIRDLDVGLGHKTVKPKDGDPFIETFVKQIECGVAATITKRRTQGPDLVVGSGVGQGKTGVSSEEDVEEVEGETYRVVRKTEEEKPALFVQAEKLVSASDRALGQALKRLIVPVDRELSLQSGEEADGSGQSAKAERVARPGSPPRANP